jgi:hypothetical protein
MPVVMLFTRKAEEQFGPGSLADLDGHAGIFVVEQALIVSALEDD